MEKNKGMVPAARGCVAVSAMVMMLCAEATAAAAQGPAGPDDETVLEDVVVTGSHVRKDVFSSPSPIQLISREASVLAGLSTAADVLQGPTVSGGGQQINNYFGAYIVDGGPGVNTLSLRGLGPVRTLVLLNGRRLAPAGSRGAVGSADLNVLPSALIERIEILKDGASSTYGSDAVAGVVNIITRKGFTGLTVEANDMATFDGGGRQRSFSLSGGLTSTRGRLAGSFEIHDRANLSVGDRGWSSCPTQVLVDPQTGEYDPQYSVLDENGNPRCFPISSLDGVKAGVAHNYVVAPICAPPEYEDCVFTRATPDASVTAPVAGWRGVDALGERPGFDPRQLNESLVSPTRNYTAFLSGGVDTGALGHAELYFEGMFHRRESRQVGTRQLMLDYQVDADFNNHPFVPEVLYAPGPGLDWGGVAINPFGDFVIARSFSVFGNDQSRQVNNFGRLVAGLRGDLTFARGWQYDLNAAVNRSRARYTFESALTDRIYNSLYVTPVETGFAAPTRVGFDGLTYTCEVNVSAPGTGCVPAPLLDAALLASNIPQDYRDYVWHDVTGHTTYKESTISALIDGGLFELPHGSVRAALGAEARWMQIDDTPSADMINDNLYEYTSAGITRGKDSVGEAFAELDVPLLRGLATARDLTLNLSARYTDYDSYGSDTTYKIGVNYAPTGWMRLRATRGTSYRAPAIFEQYLAPTSGALPQETDPCHLYGDLPPDTAVYVNCAAEGLAPGFIQHRPVTVNNAGGAESGLDSEDSRADTAGLILQPSLPEALGSLSLALDWWRIKVKNQVAQIGASNLLNLCYSDPDFRAGGGYCSYSARDGNGELMVDDNYINIATQLAKGVDLNLRYTRRIVGGSLIADLRATRYSDQKSQLLPTDPVDEFNGTITSPQWVGDMDLRFEWRNWTAFYGLTYVGAQDSNAFYEVDPATEPYDFRASAYLQHSVSARYTGAGGWEAVLGVRNLTDVAPRSITPGQYTNRVGNSVLYSGYDYYGRRAYLTLSKSF